MKTENTLPVCPVCKMNVADKSLHKSYRGLDFWFCSEQCQTRFSTVPKLYIGDPQHGPSAKQQGKQLYKSHIIRLREALDNETANLISERLNQTMGVVSVAVEDTKIQLDYDLMEVSLAELEAVVIEAHQSLHPGIASRIARAWIHDSEVCELENLANLSASYTGNNKK